MKYLYAVKAFFATENEKTRSEGLANWQVAPGFDALQNILDEAKKPKKEQHRIFIPSEKVNATGIAEAAIAHFVERFKADPEQIVIQEIQFIGETL
jgi:hypothetical protein